LPSVWSAARPIDAILIKADVDQRKRMPGDEAVNWAKPEKASRVMAEYLAAFDEARGTEVRPGVAISPLYERLSAPYVSCVIRKDLVQQARLVEGFCESSHTGGRPWKPAE
jgi:hypothetical protein